MNKHARSISHLYKPNYLEEKNYAKHINRTIGVEGSNFVEQLGIFKPNLSPWRESVYYTKKQLDQSRSFEAKQIIKRYNLEFKDKHSPQKSQKYLETLTDLLHLKSQKQYLPQRLKMLRENNKTLLTQSSFKLPRRNFIYITGCNNQLRENNREKKRKGKLTMSMPLMHKGYYNNTEVNAKKERGNVHKEKGFRKKFTIRGNLFEDIFIKPYNEKMNQFERVQQLKKDFCFFTIKNDNHKMRDQLSRFSKERYLSQDTIEANQPYESHVPSQKHFFQVLKLRKQKERRQPVSNLINYATLPKVESNVQVYLTNT